MQLTRTKAAGLGITLDVIKALRTLKGRPYMPPGPGSCGRLSCFGASQVWWCNDNDERLDLDSWSQIASAVEDISRQCFWYDKEISHLYPVTGGQIFEPGGWNVIVRGEDGSC